MLWSTQRLSTFMSTQRICRHVDITFNISTKEQWKIKCQQLCEKLQWAMQLLLNKRMNCIIANWEPYFVVYFQITLVSQRHSPVLVKTCAFYVNELPIGPCMCNTRRVSVITVTGLPFDQMEPSCSMQTRSGNPVRSPKSERDFPDLRGVLWMI